MLKGPFKDKVVVVTGAASGIGLAICRRFSLDGAKIGMLDMDAQALDRAGSELAGRGADCLCVRCDVSLEEACTTAIRQIIDQYGGIDVLVNNAGITQRGAFVDTEISVFEKVMAVNFFGSLYCTKAAIQSLIKRKGLIIVNESVAGLAPLLGRTGYSASKHALNGLFTSLRTEIRKTGTHVMIVCPGFVETHLQARALGCNGGITSHPQSRVGRQATPEDVAEAIYAGALKRKHLLVLTAVGKISYWISRISPVFYERMMARKLRSELEAP
ncbi:MAG: SDR family oxidoreductase [Desulfobacteraceae bacterium]|nr:SDR family oxidoreductase [Desulfobacterales bacterium]MBL6967129.1 SDR family oxidoreductase [Desulfobacteraceae bacterium]MBL7171478.1 SDR family oxidoreductase [Desulfobacteraceae bacterium]